ncbi:MAG TPA: hypothetical protein PK339_04870 [Flavitalea sp.]|nr:hypothetical protein [Flavitalea sp.]
MSLTKSYRRFIAAVLLLAYGFIATPVQLWHHHEQLSQKEEKKAGDLSENKGASIDNNCPVCQHQYSAYDNDAIVPAIPAITGWSSPDEHYQLTFFNVPVFSNQNKGPPGLS